MQYRSLKWLPEPFQMPARCEIAFVSRPPETSFTLLFLLLCVSVCLSPFMIWFHKRIWIPHHGRSNSCLPVFDYLFSFSNNDRDLLFNRYVVPNEYHIITTI